MPSSSRAPVTPVLAATGDVFAQPGDPSFTGCFVCGSKEHSWRSCPKRNGGGKGSGKGKSGRSYLAESIFMIQDADDGAPDYLSDDLPPNDWVGHRAAGSSSSSTSALGARTGLPRVWDLRFSEESQDIRGTACSTFVITSSADAFASGAGETHPGGLAVVDSGATETVGSLPAIEDLLQCRFELNGKADQFRISDVPARRFRFGNGAMGFSLSHLLIPQELGDVQVELGIYSLDVQNVPILLGIRSLALKTVIDFEKNVAVFASLNPYVGIPLRRSASGHVLIDLSQNWMQDSFQHADPTSAIGMAEQSSRAACFGCACTLRSASSR